MTMSSSEHSQDQGWFWNLKDKSASKPDWKQTNAVAPGRPIPLTGADRNGAASGSTIISIDGRKTYQTMTGMGASVDGSTVANWLKMSARGRRDFVRRLVDPVHGMGLNSFRLTIGTSDFTAHEFYTYYDAPNAALGGRTPNWNGDGADGFSVAKDHQQGIFDYVHALQREARSLGVRLTFFASPWSPPGWMKTPTASSRSYSDNGLLLKGGDLADEHIGDYAKYLVRYIEEYKRQGIAVSAITLQNEPLLETDYPSCHVTGAQEDELATAVKKELSRSLILAPWERKVQIWAFDHNFDGAAAFVSEMKKSPSQWRNVDGIAFHPYGDDASTMGALSRENPKKSIHLTERSWWGTTGANWMVDWFRNGSQSYNSWVTMLDSAGKTHHWLGTPDPSTFIQNDKDPDDIVDTPEVALTSQFSRFVKPGDLRIDSSAGSSSTLTNVAFKNPRTGRITLVVVNQTDSHQAFTAVNNGAQFTATVPAGNVATYQWVSARG